MRSARASRRSRTRNSCPLPPPAKPAHEAWGGSMSPPLALPAKKGALAFAGTGTGRNDSTVVSGGMLAEDRRRVVVEDAAVATREHDVVSLDLPLASLAARLDHRL